MKAVVTAEMPQDALERLKSLGYEVDVVGWGSTRTALSESELIGALSEAQLLVCELEEVTENVFNSCPELAIVASARGNPTNVDLAAAAQHGVYVLNTPGRNADSVADFTVALILALERGLVSADHHLRSEGWNVDNELPYFHFRGHELGRITVGVLGFGAVGRKVAQRLTRGFDARVIVHDPFVTTFPDDVTGVSFAELFRQSDLVTLHAAVPADGLPMVGSAQLKDLGPNGYLVNTARAALIDEAALVQALERSEIAGAALDVYWSEPLDRGHPLLHSDRVIMTPHIAGAALDVSHHHAQLILDDISALQQGKEPIHAVVRGGASAKQNEGKP